MDVDIDMDTDADRNMDSDMEKDIKIQRFEYKISGSVFFSLIS